MDTEQVSASPLTVSLAAPIIVSDLRHPTLAPLYAKLKAHLQAVAKIFFSVSVTVNQVNWIRHMLYELMSDLPNMMLRILDSKMEDLIKPQTKRMRYNIPDTLYVAYVEQEVCDHICSMRNLINQLIHTHNEMVLGPKSQPTEGPSAEQMAATMSLLRERIVNLQFLLSRTSWRPSFAAAPQFLVPRLKVARLAPLPSSSKLEPVEEGPSDAPSSCPEPAKKENPCFLVNNVSTSRCSDLKSPKLHLPISATIIKKECSHQPYPGGELCPSM